MNKSEKERLSSIISEMRTSFNSTPEVVYWGERLLSEFIYVAKIVEQYDEVQKIENITNSFISYIVEMSYLHSGISKSDNKIYNLSNGANICFYDVFDRYFCHDDAIDSSVVEHNLGDVSSKAKEMVKTLLSDSLFTREINDSEDFSDQQKYLLKGHYIQGD